jgi:DNA polymerase III delta subunit
MYTLHLIIGKDNSYNSALIKKLLLDHSVKSDVIDTFDGKLIDLHQINNALYTDSLISNNRAIIINNTESLRPDVIDAVIKFSVSPPEHVLLIMVSENADALKHGKFAGLNSIKTIKRHALSNQTTYSLIQEYIKDHNVKITKTAIEMLINIFEVSTWGIVENELNKLSTYVGRNGLIDENAVSELTFNLNKSDTFKFVNEILTHKVKAALKDFKKIKETSVESAMVIGALLWKLRQLLYDSPGDNNILKRIELIYKYNFAIRRGMINNSLALDMLIIELLHEKLY